MDEKTLQRFMAKVEKQTAVTSPHVDTPCWLWTAAKTAHGYGRLSVGGRSGGPQGAHRLAYEHWVAPLAGRWACHRCDTPSCVNPGHIFAGTRMDNIVDMVSKGRVDRSPMPKGEESQTATTSHAQSTQIIRLYASGQHSHASVAREVGVSKSTASAIITGQNWPRLDRSSIEGVGAARRERCGWNATGTSSALAKLTAADVSDIRHQYKSGVSIRQIARDRSWQVSRSCISDVVHGRTYGDVRHVSPSRS